MTSTDSEILNKISELVSELPLPENPKASKLLNDLFNLIRVTITVIREQKPRWRVVRQEDGTIKPELNNDIWCDQRSAEKIEEILRNYLQYMHLTSILYTQCEYCQMELKKPSRLNLHAEFLDHEWELPHD